MKYVIALLFALAFSNIDAQNLQFSQVLTYNMINQQEITVPSNKVWKIESAKYPSGGSLPGNFLINSSVGIGGAGYNADQFPIWLKSGDVLRCQFQGGAFISILEFSLVP